MKVANKMPYFELNSLINQLDKLKDITAVIDSEGKITSVNGNWFQKNKISKSFFLTKTMSELSPKDEKIHTMSVQRCLKGEDTLYDWDLFIENRRFFFQNSLSRIEADGEYFIAAVIRDISVLREVDVFYQELEASFRTLTNAANSSIISLTEEKMIEYCNPATSAIFNYDLNDLLGCGIEMLFESPAAFTAVLKGYRESCSNNEDNSSQKNSIELRGKRRNGEIFPLELTVSSYKIFDIYHYVIIIQDISHRKKTEIKLVFSEQKLKNQNEELEKTLVTLKSIQDQVIKNEKMASLGELTAGISHEINNPLSFLTSNMNRLDEYFADVIELLELWKTTFSKFPFGLEEKLKVVQKREAEIDLEFIREDFIHLTKNNNAGLARIKHLVQQLQAFSYSSRTVVSPEDINNLIEETLAIISSELKYKAVITKEYEELPKVECTAEGIKQVILNLMMNAVAAIPVKGKINIKTYRENGSVLIDIADNGSGIAEENLKNIFDPFFTTGSTGSTGLGLWVSSSIIQKHKGSLSVKSKINKGTTFTIKLPVMQSSGSEHE